LHYIHTLFVQYTIMPIGFHVSKAVGKTRRSMPEALREDMETLLSYGFPPCAQIFVSGPQSFTETLSADDKVAVKKYIAETGARVVIHGAYIDNPWRLNAGSIHNIKQEMRVAHQIGATGVIVHLAAGAASDNLRVVLEKIAELPKEVLAATVLWLEIHSAKSSEFTYETPKKLCRLFERIAQCNIPNLRVGLCIDTAHLFACGTALRTFDEANTWLAGLPSVPTMLHLNDSAAVLGGGVDKHAGLTLGNLWGDYSGALDIADSGLVAILMWAENNDILTILERDSEALPADLALVRDLGMA
jgi:endonuclease IV